MKSKFLQQFLFWKNRSFGFSKVGIVFLLFPHFLFSQLYVSEGAKVLNFGNSLKIIHVAQNEKGNIYIVKGSVISGLESQHAVIAYINSQNSEKEKPLLRQKKIHDSKNTRKTVNERKETPKQPTLVYKPVDSEHRISISNKSGNSAVSPTTSFAKKFGIAGKFGFEIFSALFLKNKKTFSLENEFFILQLTAHTVRPPPNQPLFPKEKNCQTIR
ncbi:MAG: hypothetical protein QM564_09065 [Bergeyella sp.]